MLYFIVSVVKVFTQHRERACHWSQFAQTTCSHLGEKRITIAHCLFATLVREAMDSDDEIFLTQNTFSQKPIQQSQSEGHNSNMWTGKKMSQKS